MSEVLKRVYFFISDFLVTLAIAGAIFVFVYFTLFRPYQVKGRSMVPTFQDGQYVLTDVLTRHFTQFSRGNVVVFHSPVDEEKDFIKRVIGMPGDEVSVRDGTIYINGQPLDEGEYLPSDFYTSPGSFLEDGEVVVVPQDSYFVIGDNRSFSADSREWGFVDHSDIIGRSLLVYWPLEDFWVVEHANYPNNTLSLFRY